MSLSGNVPKAMAHMATESGSNDIETALRHWEKRRDIVAGCMLSHEELTTKPYPLSARNGLESLKMTIQLFIDNHSGHHRREQQDCMKAPRGEPARSYSFDCPVDWRKAQELTETSNPATAPQTPTSTIQRNVLQEGNDGWVTGRRQHGTGN
jgi:hypothetical protein